MPRLTDVECAKRIVEKFENYRRRPSYRAIYRRDILPPVLKNTVSTKGGLKQEKPCISAISLMLVCLDKNDYIQGRCTKEISAFEECMKKFEEAKAAKAQIEQKGVLKSLGGKYPPDKLNAFLRRYPQPRKTPDKY